MPGLAIACFAVLGIVAIVGMCVLTSRAPRAPRREGRHAPLPKRPVPAHAKRDREFPDTRDITDPDATVWLRQISDPAPAQGTALDRNPHEHHDDRPVPALETLARIRDRIRDLPEAGYLPMLADGPPPDDPEELPREDPFAAYLSAPQPEPDWSATDWTRGQAEELERWLDAHVRSVEVPDPGAFAAQVRAAEEAEEAAA